MRHHNRMQQRSRAHLMHAQRSMAEFPPQRRECDQSLLARTQEARPKRRVPRVDGRSLQEEQGPRFKPGSFLFWTVKLCYESENTNANSGVSR
jgi:hypothetical protein